VFILYLLYAIFLGLGQLLSLKKEREKYSKMFLGLSRDIALKSAFFLFYGLIISSITPVPVGPALMFIYVVISLIILFVGHWKEDKYIIKVVALAF
jgi:hypothetical protein